MSDRDMFPDAPITIDAQIACIERELAMRARVYPRRVKDGKMSQALADRETRTMEAVLMTLHAYKVQANARPR